MLSQEAVELKALTEEELQEFIDELKHPEGHFEVFQMCYNYLSIYAT